jgi:GMP synthase-like glutamine amidotransferase
MKVLVVNNDSDSWQELLEVVAVAGHEVTPIHHSAVGAIDPRGYDLAVLSGGWWYDDEVKLLQEYAEEIQFIRSTPIPILGICIGMQLMYVAIDQAVPLLDEPQHGFKEIEVALTGQMLFGFNERISVFKNHTRAVVATDPQFNVLASSPGHAEIILHTSRPLLGVQFHPELESTPEKGSRLLSELIAGLLKIPVN